VEEPTGPAFIVTFSRRALKLLIDCSIVNEATGKHNIGDATHGYIVDTRVVIVEAQIVAADIVTFSSRALKLCLGISFIRDATGRHKFIGICHGETANEDSDREEESGTSHFRADGRYWSVATAIVG